MERKVARIDGIKTNLTRLSDEELAGELIHAAARIDQSNADMSLLQGELHARTNTPLPIGEVATQAAFEHDPFIDGLGVGYVD